MSSFMKNSSANEKTTTTGTTPSLAQFQLCKGCSVATQSGPTNSPDHTGLDKESQTAAKDKAGEGLPAAAQGPHPREVLGRKEASKQAASWRRG